MLSRVNRFLGRETPAEKAARETRERQAKHAADAKKEAERRLAAVEKNNKQERKAKEAEQAKNTKGKKGLMDHVRSGIKSFVSGAQRAGLFVELEQVQRDQTKSLEAKKAEAIAICNDYLNIQVDYTNQTILTMFRKLKELKQNPNSHPELAYLRQESGLHKVSGEYGNTDTYSHIIGLLKDHAVKNFKTHTAHSEQRTVAQEQKEERDLAELMSFRRGRLPNILAWIGIDRGKEGDYIAAVYERKQQQAAPSVMRPN